MNFTAIAIDDEAFALKDLTRIVDPIEQLTLEATFNSVRDALNYLADHERVDLLFCDIEMPGLNGLEAASILADYCDLLLFTTAHPQYALDAYQVGVDAYLLKPVNESDVIEKMEKLIKLRAKSKTSDNGFKPFLVYDGQKKEAFAVDEKEIVAFVSYGNYVKIITDEETRIAHTSLHKIEPNLDPDLFIRISRSVIVAKEAVKGLRENSVVLRNDSWHPIGITYNKQLNEFYQRYFNSL